MKKKQMGTIARAQANLQERLLRTQKIEQVIEPR